MRKLGLAIGLAAACCLVVSAGTGVTVTGQPTLAGDMAVPGKILRLADQPQQVKGYLGSIGGEFTSRAIETTYDNTSNSTGYGTGLPIGTEFGDELKMTGEGPLTNFSFAIVNFDAADLYTIDIELRFYDAGMSFIGSVNLGTVSFPWAGGLPGGGWSVSFDDVDLTTAGIYLPATAVCTQILTNPVGSGTITDNVGPLIYDPPTVGASEDYFFWNGGWYWFSSDPVANFYYKTDMKDPIPPPPAVYDNTTGSASYGFADIVDSWIGDDVTLENYGDPPFPTWALNGGMLDKFAWTFWNYNPNTNPAGIISADWTLEFFDKTDPSTLIGQPHTWHLDYDGSPLPASYYSRWRAWSLKVNASIPLKSGSYGLRCSASNVVWETHHKNPGEIGQILYSPESVGNSNDVAFWSDGAPKWGTDAGWYYFTDGTVADFYYKLDVLKWCRSDMNCDGIVNNFDIDPFVTAVASGKAAYDLAYPGCEWMNADANQDGSVDNFDIDYFVADVLSGICH